MKKIFLNDKIFSKNDSILVDGSNHHHLANVLRVKIGESFIIGDKENNEFIGVITDIDKKNISLLLKDNYKRKNIVLPEVTLFFSVLKSDKNEMIIQKCSEIGVDNFVPVITKNCIIKLDEDSANKKIIKWQEIARESAMQSGRKKISKIFPVTRFENIKKYDISDLKIFGYLDGQSKSFNDILKENSKIPKISLFIGPEGDFTKIEIDFLKRNNWLGVKLGENVMKSETSAIYIASSIFFFYGEGIR